MVARHIAAPGHAPREARTIFVVEDDADIVRLLEVNLGGAGFDVKTFYRPGLVVRAAENAPPALFLLDIMLPEGNGFDLCRELRRHPKLAPIPVLFLTARHEEADRLHAFQIGADDYLAKPFSPRELLARIKAILRRSGSPETTNEVITAGAIVIDTDAMTVKVRGEQVPVSVTEFRLLTYLARNPGRVFKREQLLDAVWGKASFVSERSVDVYIRKLREKVELDPESPQYIKTIRNAGYRFDTQAPPEPRPTLT